MGLNVVENRAQGGTWNFVVLLSALCFCACSVKGHEETEVRLSELGGTVLINCTSGHHVGNDETITVEHWVLPGNIDNSPVLAGYQDDHIQVSNDSKSVLVQYVSRIHLGDYFCFYKVDGESHYSKTRIWLYEPTIWVVYQRNVLLGGIMAGAFFVVLTTFCLIDAYRWRPSSPLRITAVHSLYASTLTDPGCANGGFEACTYGAVIGNKRLPRIETYHPPDVESMDHNPGNANRSGNGIGVTVM